LRDKLCTEVNLPAFALEVNTQPPIRDYHASNQIIMSINQYDWAAKWADYLPEKIAFKEYESQQVLTYADLNAKGHALATHLTDQYHLEKGSRIVLLSDNSLEHVLLFVAAQKLGFVLVPLNYRLTAAEIDYLVEDVQPGLIIVAQKYRGKISANHEAIAQWSWQELSAFCAQAVTPSKHKNQQPLIHEDDPILILYTSGTTGFPKGALYTHKMLFWNSINTSMSLIVNTESRTINCMPLFHTGGWNVLLTPFLHHGAFTYLLPKFEAELVLRLLEEEAISIFMGVPTMLKLIADTPYFEQADLSRLHYIIVGGEPMPIPLIERWHEKGVPIRQGYGMTEVGPNLTSLHQKDAIDKKGSIGRPNFYVQIKLVDSDHQEVPTGESGELLLKGPMVTPGYWNKPEATQKSITDGWFHTGDIAMMDEDGYLYIVDRIKNMYISGGENVYPAEVERVLQAIDDIAEAAVIGVPDEKWGEVGKAFIVLNPDAKTTIASLDVYCRKVMARFKCPKYFVLLDELPKNDTGKIDRKALS
jgi:fatty-acyl-CoA synthase